MADNREWERWQDWNEDYIRSFLRDDIYGVDNYMRKRIRSILAELGVSSVLDVGCGNGVDYEGIRRDLPGIDYTGVDVTPKMIEACKERYPEAKFEVGDIYNLRFGEGEFEAVISKDVLCHLPEYSRPLSELYRVARRVLIIGLFIPMDLCPTKIILDGGFLNIKYNVGEFFETAWRLNPSSITIESAAGHLVVLKK